MYQNDLPCPSFFARYVFRVTSSFQTLPLGSKKMIDISKGISYLNHSFARAINFCEIKAREIRLNRIHRSRRGSFSMKRNCKITSSIAKARAREMPASCFCCPRPAECPTSNKRNGQGAGGEKETIEASRGASESRSRIAHMCIYAGPEPDTAETGWEGLVTGDDEGMAGWAGGRTVGHCDGTTTMHKSPA